MKHLASTYTVSLLIFAAACAVPTKKENTMQATKSSDREIVLTQKFAATRQAVFETLTQSNHIVHWMKTANMPLVMCEVDFRAGGSFRYVFKRSSGARIEVRGAYETVDPPRRFVYAETYDFSPLKLLVTTTLDQIGDETLLKQTITYASQEERDADFDGVATSSKEAYANLARYLTRQR